jgi:L-amino acid N-acyltransferase YncA
MDHPSPATDRPRADAHQRRGIARALLTRLGQHAAACGVTELVAQISSQNIAARALIQALASRAELRDRDDVDDLDTYLIT